MVTTTAELVASQHEAGLAASWAGGADGTALLYSELLPSALSLMAPRGCVYLIAIQQNKLDQIEKWLKVRQCQCEIIIKRKAGRELLFLIKITKT